MKIWLKVVIPETALKENPTLTKKSDNKCHLSVLYCP